MSDDGLGSRRGAALGLWLIVALGVVVAVYGLSFAVSELMEEPVCFPSGGCYDTQQPGNVVVGIVLCVAGCLVAWRAWAATRN